MDVDPPRSSQSERRSPQRVVWKEQVDHELLRRLKEAECNAVAPPPPTQSTRTSRLLAQSPSTRMQPRRAAHLSHPYSPATSSSSTASSTSTIRPRRTRSLPQAQSPLATHRTAHGAGRSQSLPTNVESGEDVDMGGDPPASGRASGGHGARASTSGDRLDELINQVQARLGRQAIEAAASKSERRSARRAARASDGAAAGAGGSGSGTAGAMGKDGAAVQAGPSKTSPRADAGPRPPDRSDTPLRTLRTPRDAPVDTPTRVLRERTRAEQNAGAASPLALAPGAGAGLGKGKRPVPTSHVHAQGPAPKHTPCQVTPAEAARRAQAIKVAAAVPAPGVNLAKSPPLKSAMAPPRASQGQKRHGFKTPFLKPGPVSNGAGSSARPVNRSSQDRAGNDAAQQHAPGRTPAATGQPARPGPPRPPSTTTHPVPPPIFGTIAPRPPRGAPDLRPAALSTTAPAVPPPVFGTTASRPPHRGPAPPAPSPRSAAKADGHADPDADGDDSMEFSDGMDGLLQEHGSELEAILAGL